MPYALTEENSCFGRGLLPLRHEWSAAEPPLPAPAVHSFFRAGGQPRLQRNVGFGRDERVDAPAAPAAPTRRRKAMKIRDVMTPDVDVINPAANVAEASRRLRGEETR